MRFYGCLGLTLCGGLLAVSAYAYGTVTQCTPGYSEGTHYRVEYSSQYPPQIVIMEPSTSGPYWFECYEGDEPAAIGSITAAPGLGMVQVKVTGYGGHTYGASDVWSIQIHQAGGGGRLVELKISGNYGEVDDGDTLLADRAGTLSIGTSAIGSVGAAHGDLVKPVDILGDVISLSVAGAIMPEASVTIGSDLAALSVGTLRGEVEIIGNLGPGTVAIDRLDGTLTVAQGDVTGPVDVDELVGCFNIAGGLEPAESADFDVTILAGTLKTGGDLRGDGEEV